LLLEVFENPDTEEIEKAHKCYSNLRPRGLGGVQLRRKRTKENTHASGRSGKGKTRKRKGAELRSAG